MINHPEWKNKRKLPNCLSMCLQHSVFPPAVKERPGCSTFSPALSVVNVLDLGHYTICGWDPIVFLICIPLMTDDVEHLFMCLFTICVSSKLRGLFRTFAHFLIGLFMFTLLNCKDSSYSFKKLFIRVITCKYFTN